MRLTDSLTTVSGIGPSTFLKLNKLQLTDISDLLRLFPTRHDNYQTLSSIALLQIGETVTIKAKVISSSQIYTKVKKLAIQKLKVEDFSGSIEIIWFNQPYILRQFMKNESYYFSGKTSQFGQHLVLFVSEFEPENKVQLHTNRLVPYYTTQVGISSRVLRHKIWTILNCLSDNDFSSDPLPKLTDNLFLSTFQTFRAIHFPSSLTELNLAKKRLAFEQLLLIKLAQLKHKQTQKRLPGLIIKKPDRNKKELFQKNLKFKLTSSQEKTFKEIDNDFYQSGLMQRLLMGDVGSGKTVVMAYSSYLMFLNGYQTLILVPTEVLAKQHYQSFKNLLSFSKMKVGLLTAKNKLTNLAKHNVLIGTQALLYGHLNFQKIGLLVIDEQHKFGVMQREDIIKKMDHLPFFLMVSATPIPRSLALTLSDFTDLSYLADKPYLNLVKTYLVPEEKRQKSYSWVKERVLKHKEQVFIVCPAIENKQGKINELKTVKDELEKLKKILPKLRINSIYSHHPNKDNILKQFAKGQLDILITTSLIEVGLDIANANIILIENADRFGLSQLHQLRGRVGRRDKSGFCFLFTQSTNPESLIRLKALEKTDDASKIAMMDLKLRGPGDLLGTMQHGFNFIKTEDLLNKQLMYQINMVANKMVANPQYKGYTSMLVNNLES